MEMNSRKIDLKNIPLASAKIIKMKVLLTQY